MIQEKSFRQPRVWHPPRYWGRRILRNWPFMLWLLILLGLWQYYSQTEQYGEMMGVVESIAEPVAPLETSRIQSISVLPGQKVKAGEPLAQMDTALVDAEIAIQQAQLIEAEETITGYQQNILAALGQSEKATQDARTALQGEEQRFESEKAELAALKVEQQRREALASRRLINEQTLSELRPQIASIEKSISNFPALIDAYRQRLSEATAHHEDLKGWMRMGSATNVSQSIREKMKARNATIEATRTMLQRRKDSFTLRATRDGVVSSIIEQPGNVINAGLPILTLIAEHPDNVVAFLPEIHLTDLKVGDIAYVWRMSRTGRRVAAVVVSVSPDVQALPARLSPVPTQPMRGRRVIMKLQGTHDFIPGETVEVHEAGAGFFGLWKRLLAKAKGGWWHSR